METPPAGAKKVAKGEPAARHGKEASRKEDLMMPMLSRTTAKNR